MESQQRARRQRYMRRRGALLALGSDDDDDDDEDEDDDGSGGGSDFRGGRAARRSSRNSRAAARAGRRSRLLQQYGNSDENDRGVVRHRRQAAQRAVRGFQNLSGSEAEDEDREAGDVLEGGRRGGSLGVSSQQRAATRRALEQQQLVAAAFDPDGVPKSDWLRRMRPVPGCFVPQLGDEVVLIRPAFEQAMQAMIDALGGDEAAVEIPTAAWGKSSECVACRITHI